MKILVVITQTSFCGGTSGSVAKWWLDRKKSSTMTVINSTRQITKVHLPCKSLGFWPSRRFITDNILMFDAGWNTTALSLKCGGLNDCHMISPTQFWQVVFQFIIHSSWHSNKLNWPHLTFNSCKINQYLNLCQKARGGVIELLSR